MKKVNLLIAAVCVTANYLLPTFSFAQLISGGSYYSLAVCNDGTAWAWGRNGTGQLGDNSLVNKKTPVQVSGLTSVTDIAGGGYDAGGGAHSLALKNNGTVWAWGFNNKGQLGNGTTANSSTPVQVNGLTDVTSIAVGYNHSIALKSDGTVWTWGWNNAGQAGDGTSGGYGCACATTNCCKTTPVQVNFGAAVTITAIASGGQGHFVALKSDDTVWTWGYNVRGSLGNGTTTDSWTPVQVSGLTNVIGIASGDLHSLALKNDGKVWAWGWNYEGELGDGTTTTTGCLCKTTPVQVNFGAVTTITAIAGGYYHSLALKNDGTVWAWGYNGSGQLGDNTIIDKWTPTQTLAGASGCATNLCNITAIAGGHYHSLALKNDGTVWAWGDNFYGGLGDNTTIQKNTPVQSSPLCTVAPLPVELLSFDASRDGSEMRVRCDWSTATEINNDYFAIERSQDGNTFEQIGTVQGAGNSSTVQNYVYYDNEPYNGISYYRLRQVDFDGQFSYSQIESVYIGGLEIVNIYPNPASHNVNVVVYTEQNTQAVISAVNALGQKVYEQEIFLQKGETKITVPVKQFAAGDYLFQAVLPSGERRQKIFVH